ncbi:CAP domain-containing protein [Arthrobacter sp. EpRS71]|uniref:CAP domain-containing protein n=1 Tax=Arthrobacter sp. EpRS71 TaxID=1743141 RepID=UPI0018D251D3|nr:CAP domain-containing protein [Arthrobacter sp. EpRS71]
MATKSKTGSAFNTRRTRILFLVSCLLVATLFVLAPSSVRSEQTAPSPVVAPTIEATERVPGVLAAVNAYRSTKQLSPVVLNDQLSESAQAKATDLVAGQYWSHDSPDGKTPWSFVSAAGYEYRTAGENLAKCYDSAQAVVDAWIASPSHEAVLTGDYEDAGFGVQHDDADDCDYVVGHFASSKK